MVHGYLVAIVESPSTSFDLLSGRVPVLEEAQDMLALWHVAKPADRDNIRVLQLVDL